MTGSDRNEQQFEDYLNGNSRLSSLYHEGKKEEVPAALDSKIISAAHKAVRKNTWAWFNPFSSSWAVPVAFAAVIGLSIGLVIFIDQPGDNANHEEMPGPAIESRTARAKPAMKPKRVAAERANKKTLPAVTTIARAPGDKLGKADQGVDTAAITIMNNEVMQDGATVGATSGADNSPDSKITLAKARSMNKTGGSLAFGRLAWFDKASLKQHIIKLFDAGEEDEARLAFREYVRRYPKDDLKKVFGDRLDQLRQSQPSATGKR